MANALRGSREQTDYLSYLLRLWRVRGDEGARQSAEKPVWRASLESPHTGERMGFASLDALFAFLRQQTSEQVSAYYKEEDLTCIPTSSDL